MSRGPGRKQTAVLNHLKGSSGSVSFESLRWSLWEQESVAPGGDLSNAWNTSLLRAVHALKKVDKLQIDERRLVSFDEAVMNYPHKTLQIANRQLRLKLLPVLQKWIEEGGAFARYNPADNEKFHLKSFTPKEYRQLKSSWLKLEPQLIGLLQKLAHDATSRNALFCLLAQGKSIFEAQDITTRRSFAEYLSICSERQALPKTLAGRVKTFADALVPPADAGHLRLKGFVHAFAHVPRHRECTLKEDTVEYLARNCQDFVRSLPGYVPALPHNKGRRAYLRRAKEKHSPLLHKLFDKSIFQKFKFLSLS